MAADVANRKHIAGSELSLDAQIILQGLGALEIVEREDIGVAKRGELRSGDLGQGIREVAAIGEVEIREQGRHARELVVVDGIIERGYKNAERSPHGSPRASQGTPGKSKSRLEVFVIAVNEIPEAGLEVIT